MALRKYVITFLQTALFFIVILLLYFLNILILLKFRGQSAILFWALRDYGLFIIYSLPLILMIASCIYFAFLGNDKKFNLRIIPVIAGFNTLILLVFFLVKFDFQTLAMPAQPYFYPEVKEGAVNSLGEYKLYLNKKGMMPRGYLFYGSVSQVNGWSQDRNNVYVGLSGQKNGIAIPRKAPVLQLRETGVAHYFLVNYISYLKRMKDIFYNTFVDGGVITSTIAIFLLCVGFFGIMAGVCGFMNDKQLLILTYASLFVAGALFFMGFPYFLSLVALIKFGVKHGIFKVIIPSLFVGIFSGLIAYGLLELKGVLAKRSSGQ
jgi:hypothetical protein